MSKYVDIVFDGPPSHESGRFVEVEDDQGKSLIVGEWLERPDGFHVLRLTRLPVEVHCASCQCNKLNPAVPVPGNPRSRSWHENALTERPKS